MNTNAKHLQELSRIISQNIATNPASPDPTPSPVEVSKANSERLGSLRKNFDERYRLSIPVELMSL